MVVPVGRKISGITEARLARPPATLVRKHCEQAVLQHSRRAGRLKEWLQGMGNKSKMRQLRKPDNQI